MRLRFSLRLIFGIVALVGVALYGLYVRPTDIAERFVAAVQARDFAAAQSLLVDPSVWDLERPRTSARRIQHVYAELLPREWQDIWGCRRRVIFRVAYREDTPVRHVAWTQDTDAVATWNGVKMSGFPARTMVDATTFEPYRIEVDYTLVP